MPWKKANKDLINLLEKQMVVFNCDRRAMFGAPTFFVNGNMFAGVHEDTVIMRLSDSDRAEIVEKHPAVKPFTPMGHPMKEYIAAPDSLASNVDEFKRWLDRSFTYAKSLPPKESKPKSRKKA